MAKLILVKHAKPEVVPDIPAHEWGLSEAGRQACGPLADLLRPHEVARVITSDEPKAAETGRLVAEQLGIPVSAAPDLHEHDRSDVPHMPTRDFISAMAHFFRHPDRRVLGRESARECAERFERAVTTVREAHENETLAIVTHGTVIALFAASRDAGDAFTLWREMGLPSFLVFPDPPALVIKVPRV